MSHNIISYENIDDEKAELQASVREGMPVL